MQKYTFSPGSENEIDIKICNKKNEIQRLQEEVKLLELEKTKLSNEYIGKAFELNDSDEYVYVTGYTSFDNALYGIILRDFIGSVEIYNDAIVELREITKEIPLEKFRRILKNRLNWDKLKEIMEDN